VSERRVDRCGLIAVKVGPVHYRPTGLRVVLGRWEPALLADFDQRFTVRRAVDVAPFGAACSVLSVLRAIARSYAMSPLRGFSILNLHDPIKASDKR
jgi:hypothetical protein